MDQSAKSNETLGKIYNPAVSHILNPASLRHLAREWLKEDVPSFDYAGFVVGEKEESAVILLKSPGVLAGCPFVNAVFKELDCQVEWLEQEGKWIEPTAVVAKVSGKVRHLLLGERVALNCLCRASGIATYCKKLLDIKSRCNWHGELAGTRKTTPGFRMVEKYALLVGGVSTHRYDLSSMIMLKDNHIWTAGSVAQAVKDARVVGGFCTKIEVECRSVEEAVEAIQAGSELIMLDNFSPEALAKASKELKRDYPSVVIEASGGIRESNLSEYCLDTVDIISISRLVQGYNTVDLSMKILKEGRDPQNPTVHM